MINYLGNFIKKFLLYSGAFIFLSPMSNASSSELSSLKLKYESLRLKAPLSSADKVEYYSEQFLGSPYLGGALGEGQKDGIDGDPLFRFDAFDCVTFLETTISLSCSADYEDFQSKMLQIRYLDSEPSFLKRNHFSEVDWLPSGQKAGIFKEATVSIFPEYSQKITGTIDKKTWFQKLNDAQMGPSTLNFEDRRAILKKATYGLKPISFELPYVPREVILKNPEIIKRIPSGAIVHFIVNSSVKLKKQIGTDLYVYHSGLVIKKGERIWIRNASSLKAMKKVIDQDLIQFLQKDSGIKDLIGFNIQILDCQIK